MAKDTTTTAEILTAPVPASHQFTQSDMDRSVRHVKQLLDAQPKKTIRIRKEQHMDAKLNFETVCINGHVYRIMKGVEVEVPQTVADILAEAGLI